MGSFYKGAKSKVLLFLPEQQKSLGQLPENVRNRMGYAKKGTMVQARGCGLARKTPTKIT